jgi:thiol-disulfide isomerase/thioredoxin
VLLVFAVAIIGAGRDAGAASVIGWLGQLTATQALSVGAAIISAAVSLVIVLLMQIVQQQGRILLRLEALEQHLGVGVSANGQAETPAGLPPGSDAPAFALNDLTGRTVELARLLDDSPMALLLFSHPDCHPCQDLLPEVIAWQRELYPALKIAVIAEGSAQASREKFAARGIDLVLLQVGREVAESYGAYATPSAVAVAADGRIASFVAQGAVAIRSLIEEVRAGTLPVLPPKVEVPRIGDPVPDVKLTTLAGEPFAFSQLSGAAALLLFWNQSCGFCRRMLPELRASESKANGSNPKWIVVVNGSAADAVALGVRSTIVLDENGRAARAFGASGTPMALLLDRGGRVASDLAVGADEIFDLANGRQR